MANVANNIVYDNYLLSKEVEDQYNSLLDMNQFISVDNSLVGVTGDIIKKHKYRATNGTEKLKIGEGNTQAITVSYEEESLTIQLAQNRFIWNDEHAMKDDMLVPVGTRHMGVDLYNCIQDDIYNAFRMLPAMNVEKFDFDSFVDAVGALNLENPENTSFFAFISPLNVPELRKNCKDSLQYVTDFIRNGYIGTLGAVNIFTKKDAVYNEVIIATREAVELLNKTSIELEDERDANHRLNTKYSRKYYAVYLKDEGKGIKLVKGDNVNLKSITIGDCVLTPAFSAGRVAYTTRTGNTSDVVTAVAEGEGATIAIKVNGTTVNNGEAATWKEGVNKNTVAITVTKGTESKTYTVVVTTDIKA